MLVLWVPNRADIEKNPDETVIEGRKSLGDICERNGVVLLDTRQAFSEHWNPVPFRDAIHPNESGNRIIAQVLEKPLAALF